MAEYLIKDTTLRDLADEIRRETGKTDQLLGASMTDELRTFSDSLTEEIALQNTALDDLEAELNSLEEGSGSSASNKLAIMFGAQSEGTVFDLTISDTAGVTEIRAFGLYKNPYLKTIDAPDATVVSSNAFYGCSALTTFNMPNLEDIGLSAFSNCDSLLSAVVPNATNIEYNGFRSCSRLESVDAPKAEKIGNYAFYECYALKSVTLGNCKSIGSYVFYNCWALTSLTIPATCTSIDIYALQCGTTSNKCTFTFEGTTPPSIKTTTFNTNNINKIIVQKGCGETYKTATNWSSFADYIEEAVE